LNELYAELAESESAYNSEQKLE